MMWSFAAVVCFSIVINGQTPSEFIEERILSEIKPGYNKLARPAINKETVTVKHGLHLIKVVKCDGTTLEVETWLPISWNDTRLKWSLDDYNQISITIPSEYVWMPDIVSINSPSSHPGNAYHPRVIITNDGEVSWFPATTMITDCEPSVNDTVSCLIKFGSWAYDGSMVNIESMYENVHMEDYVKNKMWDVVETYIKRNVKWYPSWSVPFIDITYTIILKNRYVEGSNLTSENIEHETIYVKVPAIHIDTNGIDSGKETEIHSKSVIGP